MQMDNKTTWYLTLALVAVQGLNSVAWSSFGVNPHVIAGISQGTGYLTTLLLFAIHGTIPGVNSVPMPKAVIGALAIGLSALALGYASPAEAGILSPEIEAHPELFLQGVWTGAMLILIAWGIWPEFGYALRSKRAVSIFGIVGLSALLSTSPAEAAPFKPTGNLGADIAAAKQGGTAAVNKETEDLVAKIGKLALPDFEYALALSKATKNVVSTPCWQAWVDLISAQQKPLLGEDGQPLTEPDPHLATAVEKISELLAALRPDSTLSTGCAALAAAGGKDAATLIQGILSGGALGLFKLPIPIGPIP